MSEQDGLEVGVSIDDLDVNSTAGFTAALAQQAGIELAEDRLDGLRDSSSGLTQESTPEQLRDDQGRFAPATPVEEEAVEEGAASEEEVDDTVDPAITALLEQHAGDPVAALAAALKQNQDAQEFQGRQSNEVGELREKLAKLEGMVEAGQKQPAPEPQLAPVSYDQISDAVGERGGRQVIGDLAGMGYPDGHPAYDLAFQAWADEPGETGAASTAYMRYLSSLNAPAAETAKPDEWVEGKKQQEAVDLMAARVAAKHADFDTLPIKDVANDPATPDFITKALDSDDLQIQEQALETVIQLARARLSASNAATAQAQQQVQQESKQRKLSTQVASGSLRPVPERQPDTPDSVSKEEATKSFQERILGEANRTSVKDGLTFAR